MKPPAIIIGGCVGENGSPCPKKCPIYTPPDQNPGNPNGTLGNCILCGCPNHTHARYYAEITDGVYKVKPYGEYFSSSSIHPLPASETRGYEALSQASQASQASKVTPLKRSLPASANSQSTISQQPQYNSSRQVQPGTVQHTTTYSTTDQRGGQPELSYRIGAQSATSKKKRKPDPSQKRPKSIGDCSAIKFFGRTDGLAEEDIIKDSAPLSHPEQETLSSQGIHLVNDRNVEEILEMENIDKLTFGLGLG